MMPADPRRAVRLHAWAVAVVAVVVGGLVLPAVWRERDHHDFGQFYMGGVMARAGRWDAIYPVPWPWARVNPGWPYGSEVKPAYAAAAAERGVPNTFRYIQLPPNAVLYEPLSLLSYQAAYRAWHVIMLALLVLAAAQAGRVYTALGGPGAWGPAAVTVLVGCSPLMLYTARVSNTGPLLAACVGATVLGLLRPERSGWAGVAGGVVVGGYTKLAPGVLLPVAVAMRRWRTVFVTVAVGLGVAVALLPITGLAMWREFFAVLWPPLQKSSDSEACQSLYGFVARVTHQFPLGRPAAVVVVVARDLAGLVVGVAVLARRRAFWADPLRVAAACAALMAWLLCFAPVAWQFYHCMLTPLWGWLAVEFVRGRTWVRGVVVAAIALTIVPSPHQLWGKLPEPLPSRQLFSGLLILGLALWRLRPGVGRSRDGSGSEPIVAG